MHARMSKCVFWRPKVIFNIEIAIVCRKNRNFASAKSSHKAIGIKKEEYHLTEGNTDVTAIDTEFTDKVPTELQMGKVYARLIDSISKQGQDLVRTIQNVYASPVCNTIDNYNSSAYYEPSYILTRAYLNGAFWQTSNNITSNNKIKTDQDLLSFYKHRTNLLMNMKTRWRKKTSISPSIAWASWQKASVVTHVMFTGSCSRAISSWGTLCHASTCYILSLANTLLTTSLS